MHDPRRRTGPKSPPKPLLAVTLSHLGHLSAPRQTHLLDIARAADDAGVYQLVLSEHVVFAGAPQLHGGTGKGVFPFPADEEYPDPFVALAAIAAVTKRSRISTNVLIGPLRPAVLIAKMAATLDVLSGGRFDMGVGTGWHIEEFEALGVPMRGRGRRLEETIGACRALWRSESASFSSASVSFADLHCSPRPIQDDGIPVWFGGPASEITAERVATLGEGWSVIGNTPSSEVARGILMIEQACFKIGRDPREISVRVNLPLGNTPSYGPSEMISIAKEYLSVGATVVQLPPLKHFVSDRSQIQPFLREVIRGLAVEN